MSSKTLLGVYVGLDLVTNAKAMIAQLADVGVNCIWLRHGSVEEQAKFAIEANIKGIAVIAAPDSLDVTGVQNHKRNAAYVENALADAISTWAATGPRVPPLAWCLGDEPHVTIADFYENVYVPAAKRILPSGHKTCVVATRGDIGAYQPIGLDYVCQDLYSFRWSGVGGGYPEGYLAWLSVSRPWCMGQAFSSRGVYRMPTVGELTWQIYSAVALGMRGIFMFSWGDQTGPSPEYIVPINQAGNAIQVNALSVAYRRIAKWPELGLDEPIMIYPNGSVVTYCRDGKRLVVCNPEKGEMVTVKTNHWIMRDYDTGWPVLAWNKVLNVTLKPGEARLFVPMF